MKPERQALPYFRMYANAILADADFNALTDTQTGWYFRLMLESWLRAGFLPDADETLRVLAGSPRRDRWDQHKSAVLSFFERQQHEGTPMLVNTELRDQWLKANEAYATKLAKKLPAQKKATPATAQRALTPPSERNILSPEEFARLVQRPVEQIRSMLLDGHIKPMGSGIHRDEARKLGAAAGGGK